MKKAIFKLYVMLILTAAANVPMLVSGQSTSDYEICQGSTESYWIESPVAGSTFAWSITPGASGTEWTVTENNNDTIQVQWILPETYTVQVIETTADNCVGDPVLLHVTVNEQPTVADAGPDQIVCDTLDATMAGNIATVGTGTWSQVSGPGTVTFTGPSDPLSPITATDYGEYVLRWTIINGVCPASIDEVTIKFSPKPVTNGIWHN